MSPEVAALEQAERELADVTRRLAALEHPEARSWVAVGGIISRDERRAEALLAELQAEPPGPRPPPWPKSEPVRTSFDAVYPGMPPAVKLSA